MPSITSSPYMPTRRGAPRVHLTAIEDLAISLTYKVLGESRYNRTAMEYEEIAARLPPLKQLRFQINQMLREFAAAAGKQRREFCRFKAGDERIVYETYPDRISRETLRTALLLHGFRIPRRRRRLTH